MKYELQRSQFYQDLGGIEKAPIEEEEIKNFWNTIWCATECEKSDYSEYLRGNMYRTRQVLENISPLCWNLSKLWGFFLTGRKPETTGFSASSSKSALRYIQVYIYRSEDSHGKTTSGRLIFQRYYIPDTKRYSKTRKWFLANNLYADLYKLTTKWVTKVMQLVVEQCGLLFKNQLGTVRIV